MRCIFPALAAAAFIGVSPQCLSEDYATGQDAFNVGDYETALAIWQPLADAGDAEGQFGVGLLYANGFGVAMDDNLALQFYGLAAEQNHGQALCNLGTMHANGWGVPQSDAEAFNYYIRAAELGVTEAQNSVSRMYTLGYGTEQNIVEAHKWLAIAMEFGDLGAHYKLEELVGQMSPEEVAEAASLTADWIEANAALLADNDLE